MQLRRTSWSTASRPSPIGLSWCPISRLTSGKREERRLRQHMVLRMVRHVPAQQTHRQAGPRRARVGANVGSFLAALVLRNAPGALQRLAHHARDQPVDERRDAPEIDRGAGDHAVDGQHDARLVVDPGQVVLRHVPGVLRPHAPHGVLGDDDRERGPEPPAEQLLEIVLPSGRARQHHRRVLALDLGVGVVHRVAISVPGRLADVDEAHQPIGRPH